VFTHRSQCSNSTRLALLPLVRTAVVAQHLHHHTTCLCVCMSTLPLVGQSQCSADTARFHLLSSVPVPKSRCLRSLSRPAVPKRLPIDKLRHLNRLPAAGNGGWTGRCTLLPRGIYFTARSRGRPACEHQARAKAKSCPSPEQSQLSPHTQPRTFIDLVTH